MAASGTIIGTSVSGSRLYVDWTQSEINPESYNSKLTYSISFAKPVYPKGTCVLNISIGDNTVRKEIPAGSLTSATTKVYSGQIYIPYSNGTATPLFNASLVCGYGKYPSDPNTYYLTVTAYKTLELDGFESSYITTSSTTSIEINGTNKLRIGINKNYTPCRHELTITFGNKTISATDVNTMYEFAPPLEWITEMPDITSKLGRVTIAAKCNGRTIGNSDYTSIILKVPENIKPLLTGLTDEKVNGDVPPEWGLYVQGKSKAKISMQGVSGIYGSTITEYCIKETNGTVHGKSEITTGFIERDGVYSFTAYVIDSRGRKSEEVQHSIQVAKYEEPEFVTAYAKRYKDGAESDEGTELRVKADYKYTDLGGKNQIQTKIDTKQVVGTAWINEGPITKLEQILRNVYSAEISWNVRFTIADAIVTKVLILDVDTAKVLVDLKVGGLGLGIGKIAEEDLFDVAMEARFRESVELIQNEKSVNTLQIINTVEKLNQILTGAGANAKVKGLGPIDISDTSIKKIIFTEVLASNNDYFDSSLLSTVRVLDAGLYNIELNFRTGGISYGVETEMDIMIFVNGQEKERIKFNGNTDIRSRFEHMDKIMRLEGNDKIEIYAQYLQKNADAGTISVKESILTVTKIL